MEITNEKIISILEKLHRTVSKMLQDDNIEYYFLCNRFAANYTGTDYFSAKKLSEKVMIKPSREVDNEFTHFTAHKYWNNFSSLEAMIGWWVLPGAELDSDQGSIHEIILHEELTSENPTAIMREVLEQKALYLKQLISYYHTNPFTDEGNESEEV